MEEKPMIMERPQRGREMVSKQVPGELVGEGHRAQLMHEGYVGETKYMVPDSNLEVMKELVDYELGKSQYAKGKYSKVDFVDSKYSKKTEIMKSKLDDESSIGSTDSNDTRKRRKSSSSKISSTSETDEDETSKSELSSKTNKGWKPGESSGTSYSPKEPTSKYRSPRKSSGTSDVTKSRDTSVTEEESDDQTSQSTLPHSEKYKQGRDSRGSNGTSRSSDPSKHSRSSAAGKSPSAHGDPRGPNYAGPSRGTGTFSDEHPFNAENIRFLISGHTKSDPSAKPIFIFNQYDGGSPFGSETPDFSTNKTTGDLTLGVTGKFYKESILEEVDGVPNSLKIKPEKILIDSKCKVCEEEFSANIIIGDYAVKIDGNFMKQAISNKFTPFFTFKVQSTRSSEMDSTPKKEKVISNLSPAQVYIANFGNITPFKKKTTEGKKKSSKTHSSSIDAEEGKRVNRGHQDFDFNYEIITVEPVDEPNLVCKNTNNYKISKLRKHRPEDAGACQPSTSSVVYQCNVRRHKKQSYKQDKDSVLKRISNLFFPDS